MYGTILVPLDGSERAEAILCYVEELAGRYDATVILTQVVESMPLRLELEIPDWAFEKEYGRRTRLAEIYLADLQGNFCEKGIRSRACVVSGPVVDAIVGIAEREDVDLVAMASHGRTGLSHVFYGSVAAGVLHRIDRPLLLIRSRKDECRTMSAQEA